MKRRSNSPIEIIQVKTGLRGFVIDAAVGDTAARREATFLAMGCIRYRSLYKNVVGQINVPICIGGGADD